MPYTTEPAQPRYTRAMTTLHIVDQIEQPLLPLPAWMVDPSAPPARLAALRKANEIATFSAKFETIIDQITCGQPLKTLLGDDPRNLDYARFLAWVMKDEKRKNRYHEAQRVAAEVISTQMLEIADARDTIEDVQRSTLRINTRKWYLGVLDRKRFGEVKQIDQTVTIDMVGAMEAARERASRARGDIIDVKPKEIEP